MRIRNIQCALLLGACAMVSCRNNGAEVQSQAVTFRADTVTVSQSSPVSRNLKLATASLTPFSNEFRTVGTARAETGRYAEVVLPFDGRITRSLVSLGQRVAKGQPLFEMFSPDFNELVKAYYQALRTSEKVSADFARKKGLYEHGVISKREFDELFAEEENARHDLESAEATLQIYNVDVNDVKVGQPVCILAPISGEIVANNITAGQYVKSDAESPVIVADLSRIWVTALVKEHYISNVSRNAGAEVILESDGSVINAEILNIGSVVDEETRSVQVVLGCDNSDRRLKHGMFVSVHFISEPQDAVVVPSTAVFQGEQSSYVFVEADTPDVYVRRKVVVSGGNDDNTAVCIRSGLKAGETYISEGGIYLAE